MEFTGERFIPGCHRQLAYEHYQRYLFACNFAKDMAVLDLASGEGYGSSILSKYARMVIGLDVDEESIKHASFKYKNKNLIYRKSDCRDIQNAIEGQSFDVITAFELIEHLDFNSQKKVLEEVRGALKKDGLFIISSPNRPVYKARSCPDNEYHLGELDLAEFSALLKRYFKNIYLFGQRMESTSILWPINYPSRNFSSSFSYILDHNPTFEEGLPSADRAMYFIAVCSIEREIDIHGSLLVDSRMEYMYERDKILETNQDKLNRLEKHVKEIYESRSWRITAPLRWLTSRVKRK